VTGEGEGQVPAEEPPDGGNELHPELLGRSGGIHHQRRLRHRQQHGGAGVEALRHREENWLFFRSDRGGRALAIFASFTETCKKFSINPWQYLKDTLERLPVTPRESLHTLRLSCKLVNQMD